MASNITTLLAMLTAMIGSTLLLLPIQFINLGLMPSLILSLPICFFNYYSCYITSLHIHKKQPKFKTALSRHYRSYGSFSWYDFFTALSDQLAFYSYFNLLTTQWSSIFFRYPKIVQFLPYIVALTIYIYNIINLHYRFSLNIMCYGILAYVIYFFFVTFIFSTRPEGPNIFPIYTFNINHLSVLIGTMTFAITIQSIFNQLLKQNNDYQYNPYLLFLSYFFGMIYYLYCGFTGGYAIVNRKLISGSGKQSIMDYFATDEIQALIVCLIFIIHIYAIWPQWSLIHRQRLLSLFNFTISNRNTYIYYFFNITIGLILYVTGVSLSKILSINGGICMFFTTYLIPIVVHYKCTYMNVNKSQIHQQQYANLHQEIDIEQQNKDKKQQLEKIDNNNNNLQNTNNNKKKQNNNEQIIQQGKLQDLDQICRQNRQFRIGKFRGVCDQIILLLMLMFGIFALIWTIYDGLFR